MNGLNPIPIDDLLISTIEANQQQKPSSKSVSDKVFKLPLKAVDYGDFIKMFFPPRENMLAPWLPAKGLAMVHAYRGVGKTWFSLSVAYAVATGSDFLKWQAPNPKRVLYIDGEMPAIALQERIKTISDIFGKIPLRDYFNFLAGDMNDEGLPDISTKEGQALFKPFTDKADLIILDNLSTLARTGKENDAEAFVLIQEWLLDLRRDNKSVLIIHHEGKGGTMRGSSKREDVLDSVIQLKRPADYDAEQGCRFEIVFSKSRGFCGESAKSFEAQLSNNIWSISEIENRDMELVRSLKDEGLSIRDIAEQTGISKSSVGRLLKKYEDLIKL